MALNEDFRILPRKPAARALVPITARELVEWTYAAQRAQGVPELRIEPQNRSQTGIVVDRLLDFAALGCRVDVSSNAAMIWGETRCHEDAITVHTVVHGLPRHQHQLLIDHGRARTPPDWQPKTFPLACVPVPGSKGRPKGIYMRNSNEQIGCEIAYEGDWPSRDFAIEHRTAADVHRRAWAERREGLRTRRKPRGASGDVDHNWSAEPLRRCADEVLAQARKIYRDWYEGLRAVYNSLDSDRSFRLTRYRISDLGAAREPWRA